MHSLEKQFLSLKPEDSDSEFGEGADPAFLTSFTGSRNGGREHTALENHSVVLGL